MKIGKYELGDWQYKTCYVRPYKNGYAWYRFAEINSHHSEACVTIYNWYSHAPWAFEELGGPRDTIEAHDSLVWEPFFHYRFKFIQPIYQKAYPGLLMMTENEAKVAVDERLEKIANLIAFA